MKKSEIRPLDILILLIIITGGIYLTAKSHYQKGSKVKVEANGTSYEYSLSKDGTYKVQGPLGETTFEINHKRVRIIDSPCPNKNCIAQGYHNPLVCLPNKVIITIQEENKEVDFDAISQ